MLTNLIINGIKICVYPLNLRHLRAKLLSFPLVKKNVSLHQNK